MNTSDNYSFGLLYYRERDRRVSAYIIITLIDRAAKLVAAILPLWSKDRRKDQA